MLEEVYALFKSIANSAEKGGIGDPGSDPILDMAQLLSDLVPVFSRILVLFSDESMEKGLGPKVKEALRLYENIKDSIPQSLSHADFIARQLLDVLALPMWRFRWYIYEVWATVSAISALKSYRAKLEVINGVVQFRRGSATTVGRLVAKGGIQLELVAQVETPVVGVPHRHRIQPDLRISQSPASLPNNTVVAVEFKQRVYMSPNDMIGLLELYEKGSPKATRIILINYDKLPSMETINCENQEIICSR